MTRTKPQWCEIRETVFNWTRTKFPFQIAIGNWQFEIGISWTGVLAQLVERLNGIEEVRGSNPLGSKIFQAVLEPGVARPEQMPVVGVGQIG